MAQVFLYPATGESPLDEDGNPFPATGLRVTMNAYYEGQCRQGLLVRQDPSAFSSVAQPAVYAPFSLGYVTTQLATLPISRDQRELVTLGYATNGDGGGWRWRGVAGGTVDPDDYAQIATSDGYWQALPDGNKVNVRALGAGFGSVTDAVRMRSAWQLAGQGGEVLIPEANYTWNDLITFTPLDYQKITGIGRALITRVNAYGAMDLRGTTGVTVTGLEIAMDYWQPFVRIFDCTEGATKFTIRDCIAYMTENALVGIDTLGHTLHAVICNDSEHGTVEGCRFKYLQVKLSSDASARNMRVERNYFDNPIDFAVSCAPSSGDLTIDYQDIIIRGNIVNNPRHSGVFYVGADSEVGHIDTLHRVAVEDNIVYQNVNLAGVQVLFHLADDSRDISICRNILRNDDGTLDENSSIMRVRSNHSDATVDGLRVCDNIIYGADQAGIDLDLQGRNVIVSGNDVRNTRGIWLRAIQGDVVNAKFFGNVVGGRGFAPFQFYATGGDISKLTISDNDAFDAQGTFEGNAGFYFEAAASQSITGRMSFNSATVVDTGGIAAEGRLNYFLWTHGSGTVDLMLIDNDAADANMRFARRLATTTTLRGHGNVGPYAPNSHPSARTGTVTISDGATSAAVTFGAHEQENDGSYFPALTVAGISGAAAVTTPYPSAIATTGFTVNVPTAPGGGTSITIRWEIARP